MMTQVPLFSRRFGKYILVIVLMTNYCYAVNSIKTHIIQQHNRYTIKDLINIDSIDSVCNFVQKAPLQDSAATERTVVRLFSDSSDMFLVFRCEDTQPSKIIKKLNPRDKSSGDRVSVFLSTVG